MAAVEDAAILGSREDASSGPLQARLAQELPQLGLAPHSFVGVPANYYEVRPGCARYLQDIV